MSQTGRKGNKVLIMPDVDESDSVLFGQEFATTLVLFEEAIASNLNLNATDYRCLIMILKGDNITAKSLSEMTGLTTGAITGVIDRLEEKKYVKRVDNPNDRRSIIIEPQISYQNLSKRVDPIFSSFGNSMTELFENYNEDQIKLILEFLSKFVNVIKSETMKIRKDIH